MINNQIIAGTKLPELTNPASKMDIVYGKQVIDANGDVITGSITEIQSGNTYRPIPPTNQAIGASVSFSTNVVNNLHSVNCICRYNNFVRNGAIIQVPIIPSMLGDATAADVASGKTFTSSKGFAVTGTNTAVANTINTICCFDLSSCSDTQYSQNISTSLAIHMIYNKLCVIDVKDNIYIQQPVASSTSEYTYGIYVYGGYATITIVLDSLASINVSVRSNSLVPVNNCIKTIYCFNEINFK